MDSQAQNAIASYQEALVAFDEATAETQASLEACGWKWVKRNISGYTDAYSDKDYQYMLVSPKMFEALGFEESEEEEDAPEIAEEPNYMKWFEWTDYILF